MFSYFKVQGQSMEPNFAEGDFVFVLKKFCNFEVGDTVVLHHPALNQPLLKRIKKIRENYFWVEGDNEKESQDSRSFGWVTSSQIIGKAYRIAKRG